MDYSKNEVLFGSTYILEEQASFYQYNEKSGNGVLLLLVGASTKYATRIYSSAHDIESVFLTISALILHHP